MMCHRDDSGIGDGDINRSSRHPETVGTRCAGTDDRTTNGQLPVVTSAEPELRVPGSFGHSHSRVRTFPLLARPEGVEPNLLIHSYPALNGVLTGEMYVEAERAGVKCSYRSFSTRGSTPHVRQTESPLGEWKVAGRAPLGIEARVFQYGQSVSMTSPSRIAHDSPGTMQVSM